MNIQKIQAIYYKQMRSGASHYEAVALTKRTMVADSMKGGKYTEEQIRAFVDDILMDK